MLFHQDILNGFQVIERALFCIFYLQILLLMIIITLFQEDNIFGTYLLSFYKYHPRHSCLCLITSYEFLLTPLFFKNNCMDG